MANEFTLSGSIAYDDAEDTDFSIAVTNKLATITTKRYTRGKVSVATTETALDLGTLSAPFGLAMFINRDTTNYVEIRMATGAANDHIRINAGEFALFRFGSDVTAPYAIANTAAVQLEYCVWAP